MGLSRTHVLRHALALELRPNTCPCPSIPESPALATHPTSDSPTGARDAAEAVQVPTAPSPQLALQPWPQARGAQPCSCKHALRVHRRYAASSLVPQVPLVDVAAAALRHVEAPGVPLHLVLNLPLAGVPLAPLEALGVPLVVHRRALGVGIPLGEDGGALGEPMVHRLLGHGCTRGGRRVLCLTKPAVYRPWLYNVHRHTSPRDHPPTLPGAHELLGVYHRLAWGVGQLGLDVSHHRRPRGECLVVHQLRARGVCLLVRWLSARKVRLQCVLVGGEHPTALHYPWYTRGSDRGCESARAQGVCQRRGLDARRDGDAGDC